MSSQNLSVPDFSTLRSFTQDNAAAPYIHGVSRDRRTTPRVTGAAFAAIAVALPASRPAGAISRILHFTPASGNAIRVPLIVAAIVAGLGMFVSYQHVGWDVCRQTQSFAACWDQFH